MAANGIRRLAEVIGRRDLLEKRTRPRRQGRRSSTSATSWGRRPRARRSARRRAAAAGSSPRSGARREEEAAAPRRRRRGGRGQGDAHQRGPLRGRGRGRRSSPAGSATPASRRGRLVLRHRGAAGHFYAAYAVKGMELYLHGLAADSCFTAAYGGKLVVVPEGADTSLTVVGQHVRLRRARGRAPTSPGAAATASASACARATRARARASWSRASRPTPSST